MYERTQLANGLRVVTAEMPHTRSATLSIYVGAGSRYEPDEEAGLSHFLEHLLFKGASRRPTAKQISEAIESVGGIHNAATDREVTVYYAKVPSNAAIEVVDILSDMVRDPVMDPEELEKERAVIIEELAGIEDSPDELVGLMIDQALWPNQPMGRNVGGTSESVRSLSLDSIVRYMRRQYVPGNMVLSAAGDIRTSEVIAAAKRWLGDLPPATPGDWFRAAPQNSGKRLSIRHKETEQAHLSLGFPTIALDHPDRWAVDLMSTVLGEGMSSRLFLELREERALVYDVHSYPAGFRDTGALMIYAGCDPENTRTTIEALLGEVARLIQELPAAELKKAKEMARGRVQLRMEDTRAVSGWMGAQELLRGHILTIDEVVNLLLQVTVDDVLRVAAEYLRPEKVVLAAVGPFEDESLFSGLVS